MPTDLRSAICEDCVAVLPPNVQGELCHAEACPPDCCVHVCRPLHRCGWLGACVLWQSMPAIAGTK